MINGQTVKHKRKACAAGVNPAILTQLLGYTHLARQTGRVIRDGGCSTSFR